VWCYNKDKIKRGDKEMKKILTITYWMLATIFFLWVAASYIDLIVDNCETITEHSEYNFFVLLGKKF
jgi:hypothetical protein